MRKNVDILAITLMTASLLLGPAAVERLTSPPVVVFLATGQPGFAFPMQRVLRLQREGFRSRLSQWLGPACRDAAL